VFENLIELKKDHQVYEQAKKEIEMKGCTFQPAIDKKSEKLARKQREMLPSYEVLHKKYK